MRPELLQPIVGVLRCDRVAKARSKPVAPERRLRPLQILLAEDNAVNQMLTVAILAKRGHIVRVAPNGQQALEAFEGAQLLRSVAELFLVSESGLRSQLAAAVSRSDGSIP